MKPHFPIAAIALLIPATARADVFHVAPGGSDDAAGSAQAPWATLQHAADQVGPGDEVVVAPGHYSGFRVNTSGTMQSPIVFRASAGGVVIDDDGPTGDGVRLQNVSHITIEGFDIVGVSGRGIAHRGATPTSPVSGLVIRNNLVDNVGEEGMYMSEVSNSLLEGNVIKDAGGTHTHGLYLANAGSDDTTIRGNIISGAGVAGIHFNGDLSVGGDGIISGLVVEDNIIHHNGQNGLNIDGVQDSLFRNNLIYGNALNGARAFRIDGAAGPDHLRFINNTILVPPGAGWCIRISDPGTGFVIANNILVNENSNNGSIAFKSMPTGLDSGYNAVLGQFSTNGSTLLSLGEWQGLGFGQSTLTIDPNQIFEAPGNDDYRAKAGSQVIDAGVAALGGEPAPSLDIRGVPRPTGNAIDIGAYEYCAGEDCGSGGAGAGGAGGSGAGGSDPGTGGMGSGAGPGTGGNDGGGQGPSGGNAGGEDPSTEEGGCTLSGSPSDSTSWLWVAVGLAGLIRRRGLARAHRCSKL